MADLRARIEQDHGGRYGFSLYNPMTGCDGLRAVWPDDGLPVYVAPPPSQAAEWAQKCRHEAERGRKVVALLPTHTHASWFHEHILPHASVHFLRGRPSVVCVWPKKKSFV
jgi:hypothetical protein